MKAPMRIAMVGSFPLDPNRIPGGVEAVIRNLLPHLAAIEDIDLHLVTCVQGLKQPETRDFMGCTLHYLPGQTRLGHVTNHFLEQRRIKRSLQDIKPNLVHAHGTGRFVAAAHRSGFPVVTTVHGIRFREVVLFGGLRGWLRRWFTVRLEKKVLAESKHIFVIADYVRQAIAPLTRAEFHPVANPVSPVYFDLTTRDADFTVLSVAAVQPRKGLIHLVEAVARVRETVPAAKLKLIGKVLMPEYADLIKRRISELGLEGAVEMYGFVSDEDLRRAFTDCSVFALCSVEESSPVSIAEAMTLGKPVVASAVGGIPDLVADGATGHLTAFGDVAGIADALTRILGDADLRRAYGQAARARAEKDFHPESIAAYTASVYRSILQSREGTS